MTGIALAAPSSLSPARRAQLGAEALALFVGVPVLMAATFGSYPLFAVLFALTGVAAGLLALTPGFRFSELAEGGVLRHWRLILGTGAATAVACVAVAWVLVPERLLAMPVERTGLWLTILALYPLLSAAPQELIYRPLFFRRYGALFPGAGVAAAAFGLGHLFYMNPVTILMTVLAGGVLALAYLRTGSFLLVCVLHGLAGQIVFTAGLGRFFYHGAVGP